MAISQASGQKYGMFSEGVDNTTVGGSPELQGTISVGLNADLVNESLIIKRNGYIPINTAWSTRRIRQGLEYKNPNGNKEVLVYGEGSSTTGTSGILGKMNGSGAITTIVDTLTDNIKPVLLQFKTQAFLFNGKDDLVYNGTTTHQIGIPAPASAPTFIGNIAGDLNTSGSYVFVYTYFNSITGAESSPSPASDIVTSGSTAALQGISISVAAGNSSLADKIKIYRTASGGSNYFLNDTIDISSTSYNSTVNDASLGTELELDNSQLAEKAIFAIVHDNRIFAGGFKTNPNRTHYSKIGINGPMPESFQATDFVDCNINDGDQLIGYGKASTTLIALKERSVGRFTRIQANTTGLERQGSQKYLYEEISSEITALSHHTIVGLDNLVIWLGRDDIYATDGNQIYRFGKRIRNTIKKLNFVHTDKFSVCIKPDTQQIIWSVVTADSTEPDFQIVMHYRNYPKMACTFYSPGTNKATHPGLTAASLFQVTVNGDRKIWFGSSAAEGLVYQMDTGANDNALGIYWDVRLPWDSGKNEAAKKLYHSYYILAVGSGNTPNNTITHTWEEDGNEQIVKTATSTVSQTVTNWNAANWNAFNWSKVSFKPIRFFPHRQAYAGRYGMQNTFANQPMAIQATTSMAQIKPIHR